MKVILIGYPGSQCIVPASKYLTSRYLPLYFNTIYINYKGEINGWAKYLSTFLEYLTDETIIFALDDYLISDFDRSAYMSAENALEGDVACVKLCHSTEQEHIEYPVTTQYTIWNRLFLIELLSHPKVNNPWQFEIEGSKIFNEIGAKVLHRHCLEYYTNSSISSRWDGIRLDGLKQEDINYIKQNGLI